MNAADQIAQTNFIFSCVMAALLGTAVAWVVAASLAAYFSDYRADLKKWRTRKQELEAARILNHAKGGTDHQTADIEAQIQAQEVLKPEAPWPFGAA